MLRPCNILKVLLYLSITSNVPCDAALESYRETCMTSSIFSIFVTTYSDSDHPARLQTPTRRSYLGTQSSEERQSHNSLSQFRVVAPDVTLR